jgi:hypothetical protein
MPKAIISMKITSSPKFGLTTLGLIFVAMPLLACPFCSMQGQTLTGEVQTVGMVLFGTLKNAKLKSGGDGIEGTTELHVEEVIKDHEIRKGSKVLTLNRYIPPDKEKNYKYLVYCDVFMNKVDPYRGVAVLPDSKVAGYLAGSLKLKDASVGDRLAYFFGWLDDKDPEVSNDAYKEFANADYKDFQPMASKLPAEKVAGWLKDPATPGFRLGLYASILGHCGRASDASLLASLLDNSDKRLTTGYDGMLAAYTMLDKPGGLRRINGFLGDAKADFLLRYAALRAIRFFHDYRRDLVSTDESAKSVALLLTQGDIADMAIEDLRRWKRWEMADQVLAVRKSEAGKVSIVRRAILRFALGCPSESAKALVAQLRMEDKQGVEDAEELLKLEETRPALPNTASPPKP